MILEIDIEKFINHINQCYPDIKEIVNKKDFIHDGGSYEEDKLLGICKYPEHLKYLHDFVEIVDDFGFDPLNLKNFLKERYEEYDQYIKIHNYVNNNQNIYHK